MIHNGKVLDLDALAVRLSELKTEGRKVVLAHGVFDLMHLGHIRHFQHAKGMGDVLVVTLTPDKYVNKGPHRPAFNQELRAEALSALDCVDYVAINNWPTAIETIHLLRPDLYVKGSDYKDRSNDATGNINLEEEAIRKVDGEIVFTDDITFSSSSLINRHLSVLPPEVHDFLREFSSNYNAADIVRCIDDAAKLKVLVVGEAIIDEYEYCETMGKSGKEPILAARYLSGERFPGGALATANNVASFSDHVGLVTLLGEVDSHEEFIRKSLNHTIQPFFLRMKDAPTIVKRRFVELYPFQKLFEIYVMNGSEGDEAQPRDLCRALESHLPKYDVVIVTDYGHGMLGPEAVDVLCEHSKFLAVNTQVNSENRGFNTISRYRRADYVCLSENEIRLEARSRNRPLEDILPEISERLQCGQMLITCGERGCFGFSRDQGIFQVPAFTGQVVDRVGAGDSVFAVTSLCAAQGAPMEMVGLIGNAVGAQAVATVGNRESIDRVSLLKYLESLLK